MFAKRRVLLTLLLAILFAAGLVLGLKFSTWLPRSSARTYNTPALLQQVQTLSELVTVKYVIEKVEILEVPSENLVGQMIGSRNRVLLLAHGVVKAGIDFQKMNQEDIAVEGRTIIVKLPPAHITDAYLDDSQTRIIDRTTGLLAPPAKDLEQTARQNAIDSIRRAARKGGILTDADERARKQIAALFIQSGFETVEFRTGNNMPVTPVRSSSETSARSTP
jgi:hypothetical protein